jgi:hypothetical protein
MVKVVPNTYFQGNALKMSYNKLQNKKKGKGIMQTWFLTGITP